MKGTQKRYIDCQKNPHHVFNNPDVELTIRQEVYEGVMIETRDGSQRFRISAHVHNGQLTLDITTPDYQPATVLGEDKLRRKIIIQQNATPTTEPAEGEKYSLYRA